MRFEILNVEHGLRRGPDGRLFDLGIPRHHARGKLESTTHLLHQGRYDEDHISDLPNLLCLSRTHSQHEPYIHDRSEVARSDELASGATATQKTCKEKLEPPGRSTDIPKQLPELIPTTLASRIS